MLSLPFKTGEGTDQGTDRRDGKWGGGGGETIKRIKEDKKYR
jgi:hypothetical protein